MCGPRRRCTPVAEHGVAKLERPVEGAADEALTNVERHGAAQQVTVRLAFGNDRIDVVIRDDGVGFDPAAVDPNRYGLTGIQERAAMTGATLKVRRRPGGRTRVWCSLGR